MQMQDKIQKELDLVEEYVLTNLFGDAQNPQVGNGVHMFLSFRGINLHKKINSTINLFETFMRPLMNKNGLVNGIKFVEAIENFFPNFDRTGLAITDFRLIDWVRKIEKPLQVVGQFIK